MSNLLTKTRSLNRLLQQAAGQAVNFKEMAEVLKEAIQANLFVISRKGKILGYATIESWLDHPLREICDGERIENDYNAMFKQIKETTASHDSNSSYHQLIEQLCKTINQQCLVVIPIVGGGERIGTLLLTRFHDNFGDDDLILAEYGSTIVGMEILRERADEIEQEARNKAAVQIAVSSLSYSESEAVEHIFHELNDECEGLLVASKIADRVGITRSVIVNALRKLESAGVIETRSLGMKGTYIKILNHELIYAFPNQRL